MRIVVVGGTGLVGTKLVETLRHRGQDVVAASRRTGVDAVTGVGLADALAGARVVIDVTNSPSFDGLDFFSTVSRNLVAASIAARVKHHIVLSIVGTDRMLDSSYFRGKQLQEELVRASPIPHTILRSTQFFDFLPRIAEPHADAHAVRVSPAWVQPVAADEAAAALADLAMAAPRNSLIEQAGPEIFRLNDIVRSLMQALHDSREVITDTNASYFGAALRDDTLTPDEGAIIGATRFDDWLKTGAFTRLDDVSRRWLRQEISTLNI